MASFLASEGFRPPSRAPAPRSSAWRAALPGGARPPGRLVFPACSPFGDHRRPATTRRTILLQRFSFDSGPVREQPAPADPQRHPGDEFCHPAPGPWTLIAGTHHPGANAQPPPHCPARAPRTWCARRTLPANARNRLFFGRVRRAHHRRPPGRGAQGRKIFRPYNGGVRSGRRCTRCPREFRRCWFPRTSVGTEPRPLRRPA